MMFNGALIAAAAAFFGLATAVGNGTEKGEALAARNAATTTITYIQSETVTVTVGGTSPCDTITETSVVSGSDSSTTTVTETSESVATTSSTSSTVYTTETSTSTNTSFSTIPSISSVTSTFSTAPGSFSSSVTTHSYTTTHGSTSATATPTTAVGGAANKDKMMGGLVAGGVMAFALVMA